MVLITEIRPRRRTKLFEVYSENGLEFLANEKFLNGNDILPYAEFNEEEFELIRAKAHLLDGIRKCVDILSRKDYSKQELLRKLADKGIPEDAAEAAVTYMTDHGYQDDTRYAKRLAELGANSYGRRRVEQMLYTHGIDKDIARTVCDEVFDDWDREAEKIDSILEKTIRDNDISDPNQRNKIFAKLARLGYSSSAISAAFARYREKRKDESF